MWSITHLSGLLGVEKARANGLATYTPVLTERRRRPRRRGRETVCLVLLPADLDLERLRARLPAFHVRRVSSLGATLTDQDLRERAALVNVGGLRGRMLPLAGTTQRQASLPAGCVVLA